MVKSFCHLLVRTGTSSSVHASDYILIVFLWKVHYSQVVSDPITV